MIEKIKTLGAAVWILTGLAIGSVHAASFDCGKAESPAEKFVCTDSFISKLDSQLDNVYQDDIVKADTAQKAHLIAEQRHWLKFTRNVCTSQTCFKHAYWSRLAELETFFEPHSRLNKKEADKADAIKQVLATAPLYESGYEIHRPFCSQILADLKQMKGIRFVDPIVRTQSYEDPALDPWKRQCKGRESLNFSYACLPNIFPGDKERVGEECSAGYGLPPFKLYDLPPLLPSEKKRYVFYSDDAYGPMNENWQKPAVGGGFAGFHQINFAHCDELVEDSFARAHGGARNGPNYNSIIKYNNQYYFLTLFKEADSYWLSVAPVGRKESCNWTPVNSLTIKPGSK